MRFAILALVLVACGGAKAVGKTPGGDTVYAAKCSSQENCRAKAQSKCGDDTYDLTDAAESDDEYTIRFRCVPAGASNSPSGPSTAESVLRVFGGAMKGMSDGVKASQQPHSCTDSRSCSYDEVCAATPEDRSRGVCLKVKR